MQPSFLFFDLGRVLVDFDTGRMFRQMAAVAGLEPERVREVVFGDGLQWQYELGRLSTREFYEHFCQETGTRADFDALLEAGADIFELKPCVLPVVAQLRRAGYRLGVLSNTCAIHWEHCAGRYRIIAEAFEVETLSYRVGAAKPQREIFQAAAEQAAVDPEEIFFVDDIPENVDGARAAGFDAVRYTSTPELVAELRKRGLRFNY